MAVLKIKRGATSQIVDVWIGDSTSTTGAGKTGLAYNTSGLTLKYQESDAASGTSATLASMTEGTWTSGGFVESNIGQGWYQIGIPNAAIDSGTRTKFVVYGATGMVTTPFYIELDAIDYQDGVRAGLTALPNAAADAAGGLPISDAGGLDLDNRMPAAAAITNLNTVFNTQFSNVYDSTNKVFNASLNAILNSVLTEDASGRIRDRFQTYWNQTSNGHNVSQGFPANFASMNLVNVGGAYHVTAVLPGGADIASQSSANTIISDVAGVLTAVQNVQNNTFIGSNIPQVIERPDSGTEGIDIVVVFNDAEGSPADIDSSADPTLLLFDSSGNDLSARVSSWSHPATGKYTLTYTSSTTDDIEQIHWEITGTVNGKARRAVFPSQIVDTSAVDFTSSDRSKLEALYNKLPSKNYLAGTDNSDGDIQLDESTGTLADSAGVTTLLARIPASMIVRANAAQSGSTSTTIKLDASASATNNLYRGLTVLLTGGTGAGQARTITGYNGTTKIANVDRAWITTPDNTSTFVLLGTNSASLNTTLQVSTAAASATIRTGTAQTGSTSNTIKLDTGASATNSVYVGNVVSITSGTGLGQTRTIVSYNGTTKVATVDRNWTTTPDNTSVFAIVANINPTTFSDQGVAQAATSSSITLAATASATDDIYNGSIVTILSGTAAGETSEITDYNGTTKVATVSPNFGSTPDSTSAYAVIPTTSGTGATVGDVPTATQIRIEMDTNSTQLAAILDDTGTTGVVVASGSKTGYSLASTGLDSISTTAPSGVASNFREMLVQVWRRFFKKTVYDNAGNTIKTYGDDGTTIVTTQTATSAAGVETQGPAT